MKHRRRKLQQFHRLINLPETLFVLKSCYRLGGNISFLYSAAVFGGRSVGCLIPVGNGQCPDWLQKSVN